MWAGWFNFALGGIGIADNSVCGFQERTLRRDWSITGHRKVWWVSPQHSFLRQTMTVWGICHLNVQISNSHRADSYLAPVWRLRYCKYHFYELCWLIDWYNMDELQETAVSGFDCRSLVHATVTKSSYIKTSFFLLFRYPKWDLVRLPPQRNGGWPA